MSGKHSVELHNLPEIVRQAFHRDTPDLYAEPVHILPSTARKAIALGYGRPYRVFAALKHLDRVRYNGSGKFLLTEDDLREVAKACGISKESLRRILKDEAAEGLFWSVEVTPRWRRKDELFIRLASNIRVEERLTDVAVAEGVFNPYEVSRKAMLWFDELDRLQEFSAFCLALWIAVQKHGRVTLRWADMESAWGRSQPVLAEWMRITGIKKQHNVGRFPARDTGELANGRHGPAFNFALTLTANNYWWTDWVDGEKYVYFPRANTYIAPGAYGNRRGTHSLKRKASAHIQAGGGSREFMRTNFDMLEARDAYRAWKRIRKLRNLAPHRTQYVRSEPDYVSRTRRLSQTWDVWQYGVGDYDA